MESFIYYTNFQRDMIQENKQLLEISKDVIEETQPSDSHDGLIVGMCQQFISKKQIHARQLSPYQKPSPSHPNWQPMSCHFRNIDYTCQNVRTPTTLCNCLSVMIRDYLPYYRYIFEDEGQRKRFEFFLYDRLKSIKCQFYVQGVIIPKVHLKMFKILLFLETVMEYPVVFGGVDQVFQDWRKDRGRTGDGGNEGNEGEEFAEFLGYGILLASKEKLLAILDQYYDEISANPTLLQILTTKTKIMNNNYMRYLETLDEHPNIYVRLIVWSQMPKMREVILRLYKKAKMNQLAGFLCRVMGYTNMDGWLNLSNAKDEEKLQKNKKRYDLQIKLWISEQDLLQALQDLQQSQKADKSNN